jgi:hypothetical protein
MGPSSIAATRKMRCRKTIITWISTIMRPAQAAVRPITLAMVFQPTHAAPQELAVPEHADA